MTSRRRRWPVLAKRSLKLALTLLVLAAVTRQIVQTLHELNAKGDTLHLKPAWLVVALLTYLAGLVPFGLYYAHLLQNGPTPTPWLPALRAYVVSHLGKYVPGKALVVVMRSGLSVPFGARPAVAAFATLYETLVMMAAGGWVAALGFALAPYHPITLPVPGGPTLEVPLPLLGVLAGLAFTLLVETRVFGQLTRLVSLPFPGVGPDALPHLSLRLAATGFLWATLGWLLLGLSQVAVLYGLGFATLSFPTVAAVIGSVALATVAGFAVPVSPGGLGVREWVLWTSLGSLLDQNLAVMAALALRLVWVVGELAAGALLFSWRMSPPAPTHPVDSS